MNKMKKYISILILVLTLSACESTKSINKIQAFGEKPELMHQPYLQMVRTTTATITWKTNAITENCFVEFQEKNQSKKIKLI